MRIFFIPAGFILFILLCNPVFAGLQFPLKGQYGETILGLGTIAAMDLSSDGKYMATCSSAGAFVWDVETARILHFFQSPDSASIEQLLFIPDSVRLLTRTSGDPNVLLWDVSTGELTASYDLSFWVRDHAVFSPDGNQWFAGLSYLSSIDTYTGEILKTYPQVNYFNAIAISPDGSILACSQSNTIILIDVLTGETLNTFSPDTGYLNDLAFSPDGTRLLAADSSVNAYVINLKSGEIEHQFNSGSPFNYIYSVLFTPDGTRAMTGHEDSSVIFWDIQTGEKTAVFDPARRPVQYLFFSSDGSKLITSGDQIPVLWDVASQEIQRTFKGHTLGMLAAGISRDGKQLASYSNSEQNLYLWDRETGEMLIQVPIQINNIHRVTFSPDGNWILLSGCDSSLYNINTGETRSIETRYPLSSTAFSPDGKTIVVAENFTQKMYLLDTDTGNTVTTFLDTPDIYFLTKDMYFSSNGNFLWVPDESDTSLGVWDTQTGGLVKKYPLDLSGNSDYDLSPNNRWVLYTKELTPYLYDTQTQNRTELPIGDNPLSDSHSYFGTLSLNFTPDGKYFVSVSPGIFLWDFETITPLYRFGGWHMSTFHIAISHDNSYLVSGHGDGTVRVWDIPEEFQTAHVHEWMVYE